MNVLLLTFLRILGLIKQVEKGVDQVKDITEKTNENVKEGVYEAQGKHIWLTFLFEESHWVNYQENRDHVADLASELAFEFRIGF